MKYGLYFFLFIILFPRTINAQSILADNLTYTGYTTSDGLCGNEVTKTINDSKGFLWIATHNGISRYDGKQFKTYSFNPSDTNSLRSIWVTDLIIDNNKTLWASTEWGLCWYDEVFDRFRYINKKSEFIILYKAPLCLSKNGNIWAATEGGLLQIDTKLKKYLKTKCTSIADPVSIAEDQSGCVWIGTRGNGLIKYFSKIDSSTFYHSKLIPEQCHFMQITSMQNKIWIATSDGLLTISNNDVQLFTNGINNLQLVNCNQLTSITNISNDELLCCTYNKKLFIFNKILNTFTNQLLADTKLPSAAFIYLYKQNNLIWLSTQSGLYKIERGYEKFVLHNIENDIQKTFYQTILHDKNNANLYWLFESGTQSKLSQYDSKLNKILKTTNTKSINTSSYNRSNILQLSNDKIYTTCNYFINIYSTIGNWEKEIALKEKIFSSCVDDNGNIWLGTENGIAFFNIKNYEVLYIPLSFHGTAVENSSFRENFPVYGISYYKNKLWIANIKYGLFSYNCISKFITSYRQKSLLSYETLNRCSSVIALNDSIWVGNMSGLTLFIPSKNEFKNYNSNNGLASTYIHTLTSTTNNKIWGRGNIGVFCYDINNKSFTNFNLPAKYDGFYDIQKVTADSNNCLLGLTNSFAIFNDHLALKKETEIFITECLVNGKPHYNSNIKNTFEYNQNNIQFNFTAINFIDEPQVLFYNLEGLDNYWIEAKNKGNVLFSNLSPGNYVFNVKVKINGDHYGKITSYAFTIRAAFWQTWWFYLLLFSGIIIAVIYYVKSKINAIKKKEKEKTEVNKMMSELETKLMRSQMNPHFIFNSLNSIQKYIWESKEEEAAEYLFSFAKLIRAILENSKKDFITLHEEISIITRYVNLEKRRSNNKFEFEFNIDNNLDVNKILVPPLLIQPFIENAIWHGLNKKDTNGHLKIEISKIDNNICFIIDDDGVGRNALKVETTPHKSFGIDITTQRISLLLNKKDISSHLKIVDKINQSIPIGTTVKLLLPIKY